MSFIKELSLQQTAECITEERCDQDKRDESVGGGDWLPHVLRLVMEINWRKRL